MTNSYPDLHIRSKNELCKHLADAGMNVSEVQSLLSDVLDNFEEYWKDSALHSKPADGKFVRDAKRTPLGKLLKRVDKHILSRIDSELPLIIFGGISKSDHVKAARHLLGGQKKRTLLSMDLKRFYEQITYDRVYKLFHHKFNCDKKTSDILASLCCVPKGEKGNGTNDKVLARGFSTSSRLAVWANLDTFEKLYFVVRKHLKNHDFRLAIYVDDIGITASRVKKKQMEDLRDELICSLQTYDKNQPLIINEKKTKIIPYTAKGGIQYLGTQLERNSLKLGRKTRSKKDKLRHEEKTTDDLAKKKQARKKRKALYKHESYVRRKHI